MECIPEELRGLVPGWTQTRRAREGTELTVLQSFNSESMAVPRIQTKQLKGKADSQGGEGVMWVPLGKAPCLAREMESY